MGGQCQHPLENAAAVGRRPFVKDVHFDTALAWGAALVLLVLFGDRAGLRRTARELDAFDSDDLLWLRRIPRPQGRFNAGQKLNAALTAAFALLFAVSGLLLWYGERDNRFRFAGTIVLHDGLMYVSLVLLVLVHLSCFLVFAVPFRWGLVALAAGLYYVTGALGICLGSKLYIPAVACVMAAGFVAHNVWNMSPVQAAGGRSDGGGGNVSRQMIGRNTSRNSIEQGPQTSPLRLSDSRVILHERGAALGGRGGVLWGGHQRATRRARVCPAPSTGVTPKSRLNSRLTCDALS